jgi:hypothetical protein
MKQLFSVILFISLFATVSFAQTYKKGVTNLNAGISIGGLAGLYGEADFPPLSLGLQFGIHEKISVGGIVGYSSSSYDLGWYNDDYKWTYRYIFIGARGEYHFVDVDVKDLDLYGGLTLGYNIVSVSEPSGYSGFYKAESSYLLYGFHAGARYLFTPKIGVFGELGYGIGYVTVGLNVKL